MLVVEIYNTAINEANCPAGRYEYVVKVNRKVIASGEVDSHDRAKHWSLLLRKIAEDGRERLFKEVMGVTPEEFKEQHHDKIEDLAL